MQSHGISSPIPMPKNIVLVHYPLFSRIFSGVIMTLQRQSVTWSACLPVCLLSLYIFIHSTEETKKKIGCFNKQKLFDLCRMSLYLQYIIFLLGKGLAGFGGFLGVGLNYFYYFPMQFNKFFVWLISIISVFAYFISCVKF